MPSEKSPQLWSSPSSLSPRRISLDDDDIGGVVASPSLNARVPQLARDLFSRRGDDNNNEQDKCVEKEKTNDVESNATRNYMNDSFDQSMPIENDNVSITSNEKEDDGDSSMNVKIVKKAKNRNSNVENTKKEQALKFQKEEDAILSSLPMEIKNDFKQIGFAKWDGQYQCVLQLGPYDVCPGEVRDLWMKMFKEVSEVVMPVGFKHVILAFYKYSCVLFLYCWFKSAI